MYPPKLSSALAAAAAASGYNFSFAGDIVPMTFKANLDLGGNFIGNNYTAKELTPKRNCGRKPNHVKDEDVIYFLDISLFLKLFSVF